MANLKAIRRRIISVQNTKQITRAMKLVSSAKLRRAQEAALNAHRYTERLLTLMREAMVELPAGYMSPLMEKRAVKRRRILAFAADRGLCGAFNANVYKTIRDEEQEPGIEREYVPVGRKMVANIKFLQGTVVEARENLGEELQSWPVEQLVQSAVQAFIEGECDEVVCYYTEFKSLVRQEVVRKRLLPLSIEAESDGSSLPPRGQVKYDPSPVDFLARLIPACLRLVLLQAGLDSKASEHAARMRAMDAATRNADELTEKLRLFYNRERQTAITRELIDIVGGAEAQK